MCGLCLGVIIYTGRRGDQRSRLSIFLFHSLPYVVGRVLFLNLELIDWLDCLSVRLHDPPGLTLKLWKSIHRLSHLVFFYMGPGDPNLDLQTSTASI